LKGGETFLFPLSFGLAFFPLSLKKREESKQTNTQKNNQSNRVLIIFFVSFDPFLPQQKKREK
jgi:hypothetical protein